MISRAVAAAVLGVLLYIGARPVGPLPPLGPLLDPANGVWAGAAAVSPSAVSRRVLPGLSTAVQVIIDDRGVPHIFASNEDDLYRALGYVIARDRLFQMEAQTRAAAGRLSEWAGERTLDLDRESRAVGLVWGAERKLAAYDSASPGYRAMAAYAAGVNAWITQMRPRDLPIEYRLLHAQPMKWEPIYSLYFFSRMALTLAFTDASRRRLHAQALVGREAADALFPINSPIQEPIQPNGRPGPRFDLTEVPPPGAPDSSASLAYQAREAFFVSAGVTRRSATGDAIGSNNWAVSPRRTAGGHVLLAGDPHLDLSLPSVWYEMHLVIPGRLDVAGVGFPGVPGVIIGFNRDVAWTFTNSGSDVNDYYAETVDDSTRPTRYRVDGAWRVLERRVETYRGRGAAVLRIDTLYFTHRGPMRRQGKTWLSMRWTAYDTSREPDNFLRLGYVRSVPQWLDAMRDFVAPTQNGLVGDRAGNIAIRSSGSYPLRPGDGRGDVIRDGSKSSSDWTGTLPVEKYPFSMNPEQGYLASANQQPVDPLQNPSYMGSDWHSPWRAMRINALLRADSAVTPDAMRRYQTDPGSARADMFVPLFLSAAAREESARRSSSDLREAATLLRQWGRRYTRDNRRALLFEEAMQELAERTWDELMGLGSMAPGESPAMPETQIILQLAQTPRSRWWDDRRTSEIEDRDAILAASLAAAFRRTREDHGPPDGPGWLWANARHANIHHLLHIPAFSALNIPVQGGPGTLNPSGRTGTSGASWRMVVELGPSVRAWGVYPGGQSGAPASPRYKDRLSNWRNGQLSAILFPRTPGELPPKRVITTLLLEPH